MSRQLGQLTDAFAAQCERLAQWLDRLDGPDFARPSVLPGWDVRTLVGHLLLVHDGLGEQLATRSGGPATALADYAAGYRPTTAGTEQRTRAVTSSREPAWLSARLRDASGLTSAAAGAADRSVIDTVGGPLTALDWVSTRVVELVVHCDDLSRALPERDPVPLVRAALAAATRTLAEILAARAPGHSVEVRVPPFVAVQAIEGPRHTRGTPPNVVETDARTWLRLATGRVGFAATVADGRTHASGGRADLTDHLPVLS